MLKPWQMDHRISMAYRSRLYKRRMRHDALPCAQYQQAFVGFEPWEALSKHRKYWLYYQLAFEFEKHQSNERIRANTPAAGGVKREIEKLQSTISRLAEIVKRRGKNTEEALKLIGVSADNDVRTAMEFNRWLDKAPQMSEWANSVDSSKPEEKAEAYEFVRDWSDDRSDFPGARLPEVYRRVFRAQVKFLRNKEAGRETAPSIEFVQRSLRAMGIDPLSASAIEAHITKHRSAV